MSGPTQTVWRPKRGVGFPPCIHPPPQKVTSHHLTFTKVMNESKPFILLHESSIPNFASLGNGQFDCWIELALIGDGHTAHAKTKICLYNCGEEPHCALGYDFAYSGRQVPKVWRNLLPSFFFTKLEIKYFSL
jgi:hypothetical protein